MLPDDNIPDYPNISDRFVKQWHRWMDKYHTMPDAYTQHQDVFPAERLLWDIRQARGLGFSRRDVEIRAGVLKESIAKYIDQAVDQNLPREKAEAEVARMGGDHFEKQYLEVRYGGYQDPRKLVPLLPYVRRFHGKIYEMTEDFKETSIPYEEIVPFLIQHEVGGTIATEYEGTRNIMDVAEVQELEQVRRHQVQLKRLLGA